MIRGRFLFTQSGKEYVVHPDELFLVQQGKSPSFACSDCAKAEKRVMGISGPLLASLGLDQVDVVKPTAPEALGRLFNRAYTLLAGEAEDKHRLSMLIATETLLLLADDRIQGVKFSDTLQKILRHLANNLAPPTPSIPWPPGSA